MADIKVFDNRWNQCWWEIDPDDKEKVAAALMTNVRDIEIKQSSIYQGNARHARLYSGYLPIGLNWNTGPGANQRLPFAATKALVRSVCDTATALISKFRPRSSFITTGANWDVQKQAEDMDIFMGGAAEKSSLYPVSARCFHDSTVFGTGIWKYIEKGSGPTYHVKVERVLPDDFIVDEEECRDSLNPDNTYHRLLVRADALARKYANKDTKQHALLRDKIRSAANIANWPNRGVPKDRVVLVHAHHVGEEGYAREVVSIEGTTLVDREWPFDWAPYTYLWWQPPLSGFYGDGVAYRQFGRQERITYLYRWIEQCQKYFARPTAWVDPMGGPPTLQMSNEIGAVIQTRKPPVFQVHAAVPSEIYMWVDNLALEGMKDEGISPATSGNVLPPGVESAPAQREYSFKESNRFAPCSQRWEDAVAVDSAKKLISFYRNKAGKKSEPLSKMSWINGGILCQVDFPNLSEDAYHIRAAASSLDSLSPAARMQAAIELSQTGWLQEGEGRSLLGHPDLEKSDQLDNSGRNYAMKVAQRLLKGEVVEIDELSDLVILDKVVRSARLDASTRGCPQELLDNAARFLDKLDKQIADANAAAAMAQQGMSPGPMSPEAMGGKPMPFAGGAGE